MKVVNKPLRKKDAMQLVTGQPVYMDDVIPENCLYVGLLRSPHANAIVESINTAAAMKVPGMERIFTWEDVPQDGRRYTQAGQTYPEASPYDRLVIDRHVRFVGDVVAIVAGEDEKCVEKAMRLIKVKYKVLEPLLDFTKAKDNPILVHPEDNWESLSPVGADNKRNLCAHDECGNGDIDAVLADCDIVIDHVYHTRACQQAMMETFRTYCSIDPYGRLTATGHRIDAKNYTLVYSAELTPGTSLEDIYTRFNIDHPKDFKGHSLSVSDVVVLHQNGQDTAHYVDSFGYKDVPEFLQPENYLKAAEQTTEQNYNMIDGQINNTPTAAELEGKAKAGGQISLAEYAEALKTDKERGKPAKQEKPSIRAQLKAAKEQTPKKQARQKTQDLERS